MARDALSYAIGNSASTTLSGSITGASTTAVLTSDSAFSAKSGEGMVIIDEGAATEEIAYSTGKSGATITIPLANRGLEGGSAQSHSSGASVRGILTAAMWNDLIDSVCNVLTKATGAVDGTKVMKVTSSDGQLPSATSNIQVNGADPKRGIYVPAAGMFAATTSGAGSGQIETSVNKVNVKTFDFDTGADEYVCFNIPAPDYWDLSTITAQFHWTADSSTGTVAFALQALARSNDDALDTAYGTEQVATDTLIATGDEHISPATAAITVGGTPAKGDHIYFRIFRDVSADTLGADARLLGVRIKFGISQYDDQ